MLPLLSLILLSACSTNYTLIKAPDKYLQPTTKPTDKPTTFGEAVEAIPEWDAKLGECNADKEAIKAYYKEFK